MPKQPNMNQMLQQVQKMQADMVKAQEELKNEVVEASAGGGMVTVKVTGDLEIRDITIDPGAVDPEDVEMLQDMVLAATNEALRSAQELAANRMNAVAGGMPGLGGPGGLGGLGLPGL
jgi:DNA-binding YbaB/EbfC family protein